MPSAKRILLVDDDGVLRASLAEQLAREGDYAIVEAASIAEARDAAGPYEFVILDAKLPGGTTFASEWTACPILLLGDGPEASEHIAKPFHFTELIACLRALQGSTGARRIGPYLFQPGAKTLVAGADKIRLTEKETAILKFLYQAQGTVPRETLLHEVWGYNPAVTTHTLETHIYRLRRKIADGLLITEEGGYRLNPTQTV